MHHLVLVRKPLKTAWLNVAMRPQRFDGPTYDAAVASRRVLARMLASAALL
jgi:hypothetical protein